jgi:hypothetical protein
VQFIAWQPKMFWNDSIISIAGIDICLAASGETRLSFQFDPEEKIMAFDWRKVLTKISSKTLTVIQIGPSKACSLKQYAVHSISTIP